MTKPVGEALLSTRPAPAGPRAVRRVFIDRLEVVGSIGVYEHEKRYQQRVVVSLALEVVDTYDGQSDRLGDVYDYDIAIRAVREGGWFSEELYARFRVLGQAGTWGGQDPLDSAKDAA